MSSDLKQPTRFTCFHCWESFDASTFAGQRAAGEHFGGDPTKEPACQIKREGGELKLLRRLRVQERELERYRDEDSDKDLEMATMRSKHVEELKAAEETGFARGVTDMRKHGYRLTEERDRPDLYPNGGAQ